MVTLQDKRNIIWNKSSGCLVFSVVHLRNACDRISVLGAYLPEGLPYMKTNQE